MQKQQQIDEIFTILRTIHKSHWKPPKIELVQQEIKRLGQYVFRIGTTPWVAELKITNNSITYEINEQLPETIKKKAKELKQKFDKAITNATNT